MKGLLAYIIWNKVNMLEWLTDGIVENFDPEKTDLLFILDNPIDGTDIKLKEILDTKLSKFKHIGHSYFEDTYKFPCQNMALKVCKDRNYDYVICPQDDQKITDKNLVENIENTIKLYGENLGVIGLRDGFDFGYGNMYSSEWSESVLSQEKRLSNGEVHSCLLLNDGGLVYTRKLIETIGFHDVDSYKRFFIEDDYCAKAHYDFGLTNILLGNDLIHRKENVSINTDHYDRSMNYEVGDMEAFKNKWLAKIESCKR